MASRMFHVYILELDNGSYYVGHTNNLCRRLQEHKMGCACSHTKKYPPVRMLWSEECQNRAIARAREKEIKGWRREKKRQLWLGSSLP